MNQEKPKTWKRVGTYTNLNKMKKLFFSAFLAIVAIGGALSTHAQVYYTNGGQSYDCSSPVGQLCEQINEPLWTDAAREGTADILDPEAFFTTEKYAN